MASRVFGGMFGGGRPLLKAAATSGCLMAAGDLTCQVIQQSNSHAQASTSGTDRIESRQGRLVAFSGVEAIGGLLRGHDWGRTARFALIGCTLHGPFFFRGFKWLDGLSVGPAKSLRQAVAKTAVGQVTLFPAYLAMFSVYMGVLEGKRTPTELGDKVQDFLWPTFKAGAAFWPAANVLNFMFIPATGRVAYVNACGLVWNSYLSWSNSSAGSAGSE